MKAKITNIISITLVITGGVFILGALGESDMYDEMGVILPFAVTVKKMLLGCGIASLGVLIGR